MIPSAHNALPSHLLSMASLSKAQLYRIFERAEYYTQPTGWSDILKHKIIINLFFEPSTRTRLSFEIAAHRLGATVLSPDMGSSSLKKGESLSDTIQTVTALGADMIVLRHPEAHTPHAIARDLLSHTTLINAGDGDHQHPTQALIDLFTIHQQLIKQPSDWSQLRITCSGDLKYSRAAHSLIDGLLILGVPKICLAAPEHLSYTALSDPRLKLYDTLESAITDSDIVSTFRLQKERIPIDQGNTTAAINPIWTLSQKTLMLGKPSIYVMHPGPINRGMEITSEVADGPRSLILQQVKNGIAVRMAILDLWS